VRLEGGEGYTGLPPRSFPWPPNLHEVPADDIRDLDVDCVLFQTDENWLVEQYEVLSPAQRRLPRIYLEHDPPHGHPTNQRHPVDDPDVLLVHVTHFNALMWDSGRMPTRVIEHGVVVPDGVRWSGKLERGIVLVNNLPARGRMCGLDVFERVLEAIPLDLAGMGTEAIGGLGDVPHDRLAHFQTRYRFFFHPIRYTSLGLAVCEAMMLGMPIVGLATTELATVIEDGVSGYVDTDVDALVGRMRGLLDDREEAKRLGEAARRTAERRFAIDRFARDWAEAFRFVTARSRARLPVSAR
jgi:hypothetical protein